MAKPADIDRARDRIEVLSGQLRKAERELRESGLRESSLREDNDTLQDRISQLIIQKDEPHSLDEVIHPRP